MTAVVCEALMWPPKLVLPEAALYALSHRGPTKKRWWLERGANRTAMRQSTEPSLPLSGDAAA